MPNPAVANACDDLQWEVDAFVLGDPSIDVQAFEARMLDDPELALRVADAVEELAWLAAGAQAPVSSAVQKVRLASGVELATGRVNTVSGSSPRSSAMGTFYRVFACCAAVALLAVVWQFAERSGHSRGELALANATEQHGRKFDVLADAEIASVAEQWLAIVDGETVETLTEVETLISGESDSSTWDASLSDASFSEALGGEWMLEAAEDFFQELEG